MTNAKHVALMHDDLLGVSTQRMTGRIRCRAIIGADHMVAIVFQPFVAILTVLATIDNAADTNQITRLETGYTLPHRRHTADNLMPRHARVRSEEHTSDIQSLIPNS